MTLKIDRRRSTLILLVFAGLAALVLASCSLPWAAALLFAAAVLIVVAVHNRGEGRAAVIASSAAIMLAVAAFEGYLGLQDWLGDGTRVEGTIRHGWRTDDLLGYVPLKNTRLTARKSYRDTVLYDVVYTINSDGLRVAPPFREPPRACMVFLGDSITFGEGVRDEQAFPYRIGQKSGGKYAIYNFAYSGYGPHQMLANLEAERVEQIVHCEPTHFVYLAILDHIERVAGLVFWDPHGPRFRLLASGEVIRDGHFDDTPQWGGQWQMPGWISTSLQKFLTWQKLFGRRRAVQEQDLALFIAVVRASIAVARQHHPGSTFQIILWDNVDDPRLGPIESAMKGAGAIVHRLSSIAPDFAANRLRYLLSAHDRHPSSLLHERIADYLMGHVDAPLAD